MSVSKKDIVNLRQLIDKKIQNKEKFFSLEIISGKETDNFISLLSAIGEFSPLFYSLTCHDVKLPTLNMITNFENNTLLHLVASDRKYSDVEDFLNRAIVLEKTNIFVLRGYTVSKKGDFNYASELVSFIRQLFGSKFCICIAGYPQMHPDSESKELDIFYLKSKVDAGADFIITQFFFESQVFINFVRDCKIAGITVPILPGLFPFTNSKILHKMSQLCKVNIPHKILSEVELIKDNDEDVKEYGINLTVKIVQEIFQSNAAYGYHLFTLNRFSVAKEIHNRLNLSLNNK